MSHSHVSPAVKWAAELAHVREVSLVGTADLAFWAALLSKEGLTPTEHHGKARLLILTAESKFFGIPFRELSVSVFVRERESAAPRDGAFLTHAFNSSRLFAFLERTCFATPYYHGQVEVEVRPPAAIRVRKGGQVVFAAEMGDAGERTPARIGEEGWEGAVFLPGADRTKNRPGKFFVAKVGGPTLVYPFTAADRLTVHPAPGHPVLEWLRDSGFAGEEWAVRADARHAKSKTYRRGLAAVG